VYKGRGCKDGVSVILGERFVGKLYIAVEGTVVFIEREEWKFVANHL
jgi:hypothetical protein